MRNYLLLLSFALLHVIQLKAQNIYRLSNEFSTNEFPALYKKNANGTYSTIPKSIARSLKGYISELSEARDTMFIKFWDITPFTDPNQGNAALINSDDNGATFAYQIAWTNNRYKDVPFSATTITAASIPFRYRLEKGADLEADFLNVGLSLFFIRGKERFYRQEQLAPRQRYWGWGPFIAFGQQELDSASTGGFLKSTRKVARLSYGIDIIGSWSGFSLILALGFDNAIGSTASHWQYNNFSNGLKPWIGFGFGLKLTELSFKTTQ